MVIEPHETARRVRAARAYALLTRPQLANRTSLSLDQVKRLEDAQRPVTTQAELHEIAHACEVPIEFMEIGFQGAQGVYHDIARLMAAVLSQDYSLMAAELRRQFIDVHAIEILDGVDADSRPALPPSSAKRHR